MQPYFYKGKERQIEFSPEEINMKLQSIIDSGKNFDKDFVFRPHQRKAIVRIAFLFLNKLCKNVILDAPTGSGKSIIAILTARLLREWKKEGYLITSNLDLQDQYMKDINEKNLMWGSVKGIDNYTCDVNGLPYSLGECRSRGYTKEKIESLSCYTSCGYLMARMRAINSAVSILNYNYWLLQRNYVAKNQEKKGSNETTIFVMDAKSIYFIENFAKRDFCFFDEAHRIDDIVQSHFSLNLNDNVLQKILDHIEYCENHNIKINEYNTDKTKIALEWTGLMVDEDYESNVKALRYIKTALGELSVTREILQNEISKYKFGQNVPIYLRHSLKRCELFKDVKCKLDDYLEIIEKDPDCFVKTCDDDKTNRGAVFNLLKDQDLLKNKLHEQSEFSIFMSATFGNPEIWANMCGVDDYEVISVPNQWSYEKSPIFLSKNLPSLAYNKREESVPEILKALDKILDEHDDVRGIVHSGNFYFNNYILTNSKHKKRLISYTNSKERSEAIEKVKKSENGFLIGPSLIEGLDMRDDFSRIQIYVKVPYRSMSDNYTKRRMEFDQLWYTTKSILTFIQAIGRSIRNENDWAITYLLDGNFKDLFRKNFRSFPSHIEKRLKFF